jgi:hypothetical protein
MRGLASPCFSERPFRSRPDGSLQKFPRRLGQFPLSFPVDSRWGLALSCNGGALSTYPPAGRSRERGEVGEDGTLATVEA